MGELLFFWMCPSTFFAKMCQNCKSSQNVKKKKNITFIIVERRIHIYIL